MHSNSTSFQSSWLIRSTSAKLAELLFRRKSLIPIAIVCIACLFCSSSWFDVGLVVCILVTDTHDDGDNKRKIGADVSTETVFNSISDWYRSRMHDIHIRKLRSGQNNVKKKQEARDATDDVVRCTSHVRVVPRMTDNTSPISE